MKNLLYTNRFVVCSLIVFAFLFSCEEERYEAATITFYPTFNATGVEPAVGVAGSPTTVTLKTSRRLIEDSQVNIRIEGNGVGYGSSYTTNPPQLEPGVVTLTIPKGEVQASFTFIPRNDQLFVPTNYQYTFTIDQTSNEIRSIGQKHFNLVVEDNTQAFFSENFNVCPGTKFTERLVAGSVSTWGCSTFGYPSETTSTREANAFGKGGTTACNSYLVMSAPIDGNNYSTLYISALVYSRFTGSGEIKFVYSSNYSGTGDPEAAGVTWTELSEINTNLPAAGTQVWKPLAHSLNDVPASDIYIAIQHKGGVTTSSSSWRIENFEIKGF
jgi:hypothetical protein